MKVTIEIREISLNVGDQLFAENVSVSGLYKVNYNNTKAKPELWMVDKNQPFIAYLGIYEALKYIFNEEESEPKPEQKEGYVSESLLLKAIAVVNNGRGVEFKDIE